MNEKIADFIEDIHDGVWTKARPVDHMQPVVSSLSVEPLHRHYLNGGKNCVMWYDKQTIYYCNASSILDSDRVRIVRGHRTEESKTEDGYCNCSPPSHLVLVVHGIGQGTETGVDSTLAALPITIPITLVTLLYPYQPAHPHH